MDWQWIVEHLVTFVVGLASGWTAKIVISRRSSRRVNKVTQKGNFAGGDIVGGDMHKNNRG
jgi:hypothetical protein